jgi:RNA polymerase primary sigma factor
MDQASGSEGSSELGDFIEDERASATPGTVMREMESAGLHEAIERLPEHHRWPESLFLRGLLPSF